MCYVFQQLQVHNAQHTSTHPSTHTSSPTHTIAWSKYQNNRHIYSYKAPRMNFFADQQNGMYFVLFLYNTKHLNCESWTPSLAFDPWFSQAPSSRQPVARACPSHIFAPRWPQAGVNPAWTAFISQNSIIWSLQIGAQKYNIVVAIQNIIKTVADKRQKTVPHFPHHWICTTPWDIDWHCYPPWHLHTTLGW